MNGGGGVRLFGIGAVRNSRANIIPDFHTIWEETVCIFISTTPNLLQQVVMVNTIEVSSNRLVTGCEVDIIGSIIAYNLEKMK